MKFVNSALLICEFGYYIGVSKIMDFWITSD